MKEKIINIIRKLTFYPRILLDKILYHFYFKRMNNWDLLNKFIDKDILIAGNGPSLNKTPLQNLNKDFISIGMNKINLLYANTAWRPDIIACVNGLVLNQNKDYFNKTKAILIVPVKASYLGIKKRNNVIFVNLKDHQKLESNIKKQISPGCTVTFVALQIAAYLNPKTVNIVGVDHNFVYDKGKDHEIKKLNGDDVNHFSKDYFKDQYWGIPNLSDSEKLYGISKDYFERKNIPISDYTVDGKLNIFDKKDIKEILQD